jgi:hypothetical protein
MALVAPLTREQCEAVDLCKEMGAAQLILTPHCSTGKEIIIPCSDQRDALKLKFGKEYTEAKNQCSSDPKMLEKRKVLELEVSLGCAATNPKILSALMDTGLVESEDDPDWMRMMITDSPGKAPKYWECLIEPLEDSRPSADWRIQLVYAYIVVENSELQFSVDEPRSLTFMIKTMMHPGLATRGWLEWSKNFLGEG